MAHQNTIFGYIATDHDEVNYNRAALAQFRYDSVWPLPNVFHLPSISTLPPVISFAMIYYGLGEEWEVWLRRFEELLAVLHAREAEVVWHREAYRDPVSAQYVLRIENSAQKYNAVGANQWYRLVEYDYYLQDGTQRAEVTEEQILL